MIESLAQFANCNTSLQMRGRHISMDILVGVGDDDFIITLEKGRVIDIQPRRVSLESGIFAIRAAEEVWAEHWQSIPKRDYDDLFSMVSAGLANFDGDLRPLTQKLLYFKALLESPRPDLDNKHEKSVISSPEFEPIVGRYFTMQFDGRGYTPERAEATHSRIKGSKLNIMEKIGHFPMSENPELFRTHILPVLEEIRS